MKTVILEPTLQRHLQVQILSSTVPDTNLVPLKGDELDLSPTNDAGSWQIKV